MGEFSYKWKAKILSYNKVYANCYFLENTCSARNRFTSKKEMVSYLHLSLNGIKKQIINFQNLFWSLSDSITKVISQD